MSIVYTSEDLLHDHSCVLLCKISIKFFIRDLFKQFSSCQKFHNNVIIFLVFENIVELNYIWVINFSEYFSFVFEFLAFVFSKGFFLDNFDSPQLSCLSDASFPDFSISTASDFSGDLIDILNWPIVLVLEKWSRNLQVGEAVLDFILVLHFFATCKIYSII